MNAMKTRVSSFTGTEQERLAKTIAVRDEIRAQVRKWIDEEEQRPLLGRARLVGEEEKMSNVHVHLHVSDLGASRAFYERFLGAPPVKEKPATRSSCRRSRPSTWRFRPASRRPATQSITWASRSSRASSFATCSPA